MHIKNLTNSPYQLVNSDGKSVMLPARGEVDIEPHPMHVAHYRSVGYFEITDSVAEKGAPDDDFAGATLDVLGLLRHEYEEAAGKPADKRWSEGRLRDEIDALMERDDV